MKHFVYFFALSLIGLTACNSSGVLRTYEEDDLVAVQHNDRNNYTLLIYQDIMGQTRHVLRRFGICEMVITYTVQGDILLKERGRSERLIDVAEASRLTRHINTVLGLPLDTTATAREHITGI